MERCCHSAEKLTGFKGKGPRRTTDGMESGRDGCSCQIEALKTGEETTFLETRKKRRERIGPVLMREGGARRNSVGGEKLR